MIAPTPYVLQTAPFPFRSLLAQAERLPLGGGREIALAIFVAARLLEPLKSVMGEDRAHFAQRGIAAKQWFLSLALQPAARQALQLLAEAVAADNATAIGQQWTRVLIHAEKVLDESSLVELRKVWSSAPPLITPPHVA